MLVTALVRSFQLVGWPPDYSLKTKKSTARPDAPRWTTMVNKTLTTITGNVPWAGGFQRAAHLPCLRQSEEKPSRRAMVRSLRQRFLLEASTE
jgi:hypothetical protein